MTDPSRASSDRMLVALLAAVGTVFWWVIAAAIAACLWAPTFEPFSRRVNVWSVTGETRAAAPLDGSYEVLEPTRFPDGRVFLTAFTTNREGRADFEWDSNALQFHRVSVLPTRPPPPGVESTDTVVYSPLGRVVVVSNRAQPVRWFDGAWHPLGPPPDGVTYDMRFEWDIRAVDLSDGGVLLLAPHEATETSVALLEPSASTWAPVRPHPSFDPRRTYSGPDGKVVYLEDGRAWLWDVRTNKTDVLPGAPPLREGGVGLSLDATHVLFAGGRSEERRPNRAFYLLCVSVGAWCLVGLAVVLLAFRAMGRKADATMLRRYVAGGIVGGTVALGLGLALLFALFLAIVGRMNFRM